MEARLAQHRRCADFCAAAVPALFRQFRLFRPAKTRQLYRKYRCFLMAGELGFEPRLTESESAVLPLNYSPVVRDGCVERPIQRPWNAASSMTNCGIFQVLVPSLVQALV